jgi:hypothetical protein
VNSRDNKVIGVDTEGRVYLLLYTSDDTYDVAVYRTVDQDFIDDMNHIDNIKEEVIGLWREAVKHGETEIGLDEYAEEFIECSGLDFIYQDLSYFDNMSYGCQRRVEEAVEGVVAYDYVGSLGFSNSLDIEWACVFEPELLKTVKVLHSRFKFDSVLYRLHLNRRLEDATAS